MRKIFLATFTIIFFFAMTASAANIQNSTKPRLLMAEVAEYGITELKPEVTENFYKVLTEIFSENFNVESRKLVANIGGEPISNTEIFSTIHMNAIIHGAFHNYDTSNTKLKAYADSVLGKSRRKTDNKKYDGKAYRLNTSLAAESRKIGAAYDVDYLFFCNVRDIDAWRRIGAAYGANPTVKNLNGKKFPSTLIIILSTLRRAKFSRGKFRTIKLSWRRIRLRKFMGEIIPPMIC